MPNFNLLALVLLFSQGIQDVLTNSLFVSHHGDDLDDCGNWTTPCRTVRHAVKISNDGDQIYIDYAKGRPYLECENVTQSTCSIELAKSVSFYGFNGRAEVRCKESLALFKITSPRFNITHIHFFKLVMSGSLAVANLDLGARTELEFQNTLVRDNFYGVYTKRSTGCTIKITNSSFEHNNIQGIYLRCSNLTIHINSSTFNLSPAFFTNIANKPTPWQKTEILVQKTIFNGKNTPNCVDMLRIQPFAAIFNVTIVESEFKNHVQRCQPKGRFFTLSIHDHQPNLRIITFILLSNLLIENNYNTLAVVSLNASYSERSFVEIVIRDSIFKNNSAALWLATPFFGTGKHSKLPTIFLDNNTFAENIYASGKPHGAAAVYFSACKSRETSCRFLNKAGPNLYTAVVTISNRALVKFVNCYFENRQTSVECTQLFASGFQPVFFLGHNTFNLLALKEGQSVFIHIPTYQTAVMMKKGFKILCPQGYKLKLHRDCVTTPSWYRCHYINIKCEQCSKNTYALDRGKFIFNKGTDIQCQQCPTRGNCDSGLVTAKSNFWGYKTKMKVSFIQCPPGYCCESENCVTYDSCHANRTGILCGRCPKEMSESLFSTECISNKECSINYFFILGAITMLVLYLVFFLFHNDIVDFLRSSLFSKRLLFSTKRRNERKNNFSTSGNTSSGNGMIKIFFYYYQVCRLLRSTVGSSKKTQFINTFENLISRVMNMVIVNVPSFNCPLENLRAVPKAVIQHSVGFCLLGLVCLLYLVRRLFVYLTKLKGGGDRRTALENVTMTTSDQENIATKPELSQRIPSAFTYISLLMYASSTQLCLSLLHCVPVGDSQVLFLDGNIKCYQTFQYFLLAYMISSILPFCLVPVLGSYLLKFGRIGVKQFCAACIFPLPFCCYWMYLLLKDCRRRNQGKYNNMKQNNNAVTNEEIKQSVSREEISSTTERNKELSARSETAILRVLLGPFRDHQPFMCFPSSHIPWEGFLIFRRLVLIIVLTFVHNIQLKLFLALTMCVSILIFQMFVNPFQRKRDNVMETLSLGTHVVLCGSTLIKSLYYGEDYSSFLDSLPVLNLIENILIIAPLSIIIIVVTLCIVIKLAFGLLFCVLFLIGKIRRLFMKHFNPYLRYLEEN